jgi:DNA invertase Pin-like site-specific DNA recombinase
MAAEPGPDFRWGVVLRRSKLNLDGTEESTDRQEYEIAYHIRNNNMGVIVQTYKDIASAWKPGAPRPRFKHALVDLASGTIDGLAVLNVDRLARRKDQVRLILDAA